MLMIETFNTHRMTDEVVRRVATGREDELARIMDSIRHAESDPTAIPPALIVYGERGSGKSFLMRLVEIGCADLEGALCVLLPEEQYNIRAPQQILQVVTAHIQGRDWSGMGYQIDSRSEEDAWRDEVKGFHAALDERFGEGRGLAVVLLENFDALVLKLFGVEAPSKGKKSGPAVARRLAEERLRKLLGARGGRFMLVASATGTVDMDYERPLFNAFMPVDLKGWSADTSISYYNKRRELEGQPPLGPAEEARARAITEFIGGNPRLAQLLGMVLSSPSARTIANTLDELVDHLADYYRRRLDDLPHASAAVLDAMIRGGEPVSQSALAARMGGDQKHIADAFTYLVRGRLVQASREIGGAGQLYRVRDRLFVHFYRRRYSGRDELAAIAELLERFFTPDERMELIRGHLAHGEYRDARAYGRLRLGGEGNESGCCPFQDMGITDGPPSLAFSLVGVESVKCEELRRRMDEAPAQAAEFWREQAEAAREPLPRVAALGLAAVAECRAGYDLNAQHLLDEALRGARASGDADALISALTDAWSFHQYRVRDGEGRARALLEEVAKLPGLATRSDTRVMAEIGAAWHDILSKRFVEGVERLNVIRNSDMRSELLMSVLSALTTGLILLERFDDALSVVDDLYQLGAEYGSLIVQYDALSSRVGILEQMKRYEETLETATRQVAVSEKLGMVTGRAGALKRLGTAQFNLGRVAEALASIREGQRLARMAEHPDGSLIASLTWVEAVVYFQQGRGLELVEVAVSLMDRAQESGDQRQVLEALDRLIFVGAFFSPQPRALEALARFLDDGTVSATLSGLFYVKPLWLRAAIRAGQLEAALALARRYPVLLERPIPFDVLGRIWTDLVTEQGRAAAFARSSRDILTMMALRDLARSVHPEKITMIEDDLRELSDNLVRVCPDHGYLRDMAGLLEEQFGEAAAESAKLLRHFADFHDAPDKEAYLQYLDPDLSTAIRRIWKQPNPKDTLTKRGRRRAR